MAKNNDKGFIAVGIGVFFLWLIAALLSLGFTATVIWAIFKLVTHFTS